MKSTDSNTNEQKSRSHSDLKWHHPGGKLLKFGSFKGMANQPLPKFLEIKGLGDVKIIRIAAAFEIARRIVNQVLEEHEKEE